MTGSAGTQARAHLDGAVSVSTGVNIMLFLLSNECTAVTTFKCGRYNGGRICGAPPTKGLDAGGLAELDG